MATVNNYVNDKSKEAFEKMLEEGHFPQVQFSKNDRGFTSYSLMEYVDIFARFRTIVHQQLQAAGFAQGVFATRIRSKQFKATVDDIIQQIKPNDLSQLKQRLGTWID